MRKPKKKIEIIDSIAFGTEVKMIVLVTSSISLSIPSVLFPLLTCGYWNKKGFSTICIASTKFAALVLFIMCRVL